MKTNKEIAIDYICTNLCTELHQIVLPEDLHLEHWLAVLPNVITEGITLCAGQMQIVCDTKLVTFNLTTGQPNSPEDYKTFNEITSV